MNIQLILALIYINLFLIIFRNYYITFIGMVFTYIYYILDFHFSFFTSQHTFEQIKKTKHKEYVKQLKKHLDKVHKSQKIDL